LLTISLKVQDTHGVLKDINRDHLNKQVNQFIFEVYFLIYVFLLWKKKKKNKYKKQKTKIE